MMKKTMRIVIILLMAWSLFACKVGPNYVKPAAPLSPQFKDASKHWKVADPQDAFDRGEWWHIFKDKQLNSLEAELDISNQTIAQAAANYRQAQALVDEARASYFPTVAATATLTRQKSNGGATGSFQQTSSSTTSGTGTFVGTGGGTSKYSTTHSLLLNASWEPDLWGSIGRTVEASKAGAQASEALLASTRLSAQASLAQYYFELRGLDRDQKLLNDTVSEYKKALTLTQHRYKAGVAALSDVIQAQTQVETAKALSVSNSITRAQYEHAIAILIGKPPADFSMAAEPLTATPPNIPITVPSVLLERRPDIAQAERLMAQANANIGVSIAAFFPTLTLSGTASYQHSGFNNWFSLPGMGWSLGPQLAETIIDGGLRAATVAASRATYESNVASYRQTVLTAFQDVEDNLVAVRLQKDQARAQNKAAAYAVHAAKIVMNQYKAGLVDYTAVTTAQVTAFNAEKNAADVAYLRMTTAVGLIKALGGGWDSSSLSS